MSADDVKGAKSLGEKLCAATRPFPGCWDALTDESRTAYQQTALRFAASLSHDETATAVIADLKATVSRLTEENERLREAIGLSSADIFDDLMDLYADPHINRLTYAAAKAIVIAEERATKAEAERDEALVIVRKVAGLTVEGEDHTRFRANYPMFAALVACAKAILARSAQGGQRCVS